jgi:flagellar biosynthesis/type III secretory pathway chaperone
MRRPIFCKYYGEQTLFHLRSLYRRIEEEYNQLDRDKYNKDDLREIGHEKQDLYHAIKILDEYFKRKKGLL